VLLKSQNKLAEAEGEFREAARLDPANKLYSDNLKSTLQAEGKSQ
jgi:hypothetical protein